MTSSRSAVERLPQAWIAALAALRVVLWLALGAPTTPGFSQATFVGLVLAFGLSCVLLVWGARNGDARARFLAVLYLLVASTYTDWGAGAGVPGPAWLAGTIRQLRPDAFIPFYIWTFCAVFPRAPLFPAEARRLDRLRVAAWVLGALLFAVNLIPLETIHGLEAGTAGALDWLHAGSSTRGFWTVIGLATLPALGVAAWRTRRAPVDERRRASVLLFGIILGGAPPLVLAALAGVVPAIRRLRGDPAGLIWISVFEYGALFMLLLISAYAVLARRALDVRFIVRRTLQYALARHVLLALTSIPFAALLWLGWQNRDRPVAELFAGTSLAFVMTASLAAVALTRARITLSYGIDRMFFREQYDARHTLMQLVGRSRQVEDPAALARLCATEIDRALHVERITLLVQSADRRVLLSVTGDVRELDSDAELAHTIARRHGPLEIDWDTPSGVIETLPPDQRQWLADAGLQLLVPLVGSDRQLLGILGLGEKKSGLPFSREDRDLLTAIAASAALALENRLLQRKASTADDTPGQERPVNLPTPALQPLPPRADDANRARVCARCGIVQKAELDCCHRCDGTLQPGAYPLVLAGKYRLRESIGQGGMGIVFRARDLTLGRDVAIKTLPRVSARSSERLRREARAVAAVSHPNLAMILALEVWHGTPFLVFEYLPGGTLKDRLTAGALPLQEALSLGSVLAAAVERVHRAGILHRDIKPANIGFAEDGTPRLLDFGLARLIGMTQAPGGPAGSRLLPATTDPVATDLAGTWADAAAPAVSASTRTGQTVVGTVPYMSPEALDGQPPAPGFDLWSTSMVLYECIAGRNPVIADSYFATVAAVAEGRIPDIRSFQPHVPAAVADFFKRALARDERDRPASAGELSDRLRDLAGHAAAQVGHES